MSLFSCLPLGCKGSVEVIEQRQCNLQQVPPEVARSAHTLEELYLDCNQICEISSSLCRCRKLRILSLAQNKILVVPPAIGSLQALEELHLEDNEITDLPEQLVQCNALKVLDLRLNLLLRLPDVIHRLSELTHLHLFETSLTQLPPDISYLQNLRCLDVRENQLKALPTSIGTLKCLQQLDLGRNELLQLPEELGSLEKLEELYVDHNLLTVLPDSIVRCRSLQTLDVSQNDLTFLPHEIGDLEELTELNVSENRIDALPNSISRLKKLLVLKANSNALTSLTPAIGSCVSLEELYLSTNQLTSIPSSIGNLKAISVLSLDENQLGEIPSTIGGCEKLSILTLRGNEISELPLEIGRIANLHVLDLCDNSLSFLPFTINVLFNLRALWLSVDQTSPLTQLETAQDPATRVKVLTCYLLPQGKFQEAALRQRRIEGNVHFDADEGVEMDSESEIGKFVRKGTPHPRTRTRAMTPRRQSIDGHFIPHNVEEDSTDQILSLRKKSSNDPTVTSNTQPVAVQHNDSERKVPDSVEVDGKVESAVTPSATEAIECSTKEHLIHILRHPVSGLGLTICGGRESEPFKDGDSSIFISRIVEGGAADAAGLQVGDKIVSVNGSPVIDELHDVVVDLMQKEDTLDLVVQREEQSSSISNEKSAEVVTAAEIKEPVTEIISATMKCDLNGSPGFTVDHSKSLPDEAVVVKTITSEDGAEKDGKLMIGDCILSINGVNVKGMNVEEVRKLLVSDDTKEQYLVVQRGRTSEAKLEEVDLQTCVDRSSAVEVTPLNVCNDEPLCLADIERITTDSDALQRQLGDTANASSSPAEQVNEEVVDAPSNKKGVRIPPPVAPKPKGILLSSSSLQEVDDVNNEPSRMAFSSKIKKFESAGQLSQTSTPNLGIPAKKPLLSEDEVRKLKEEELKRVMAATSITSSVSEEENADPVFEEILAKSIPLRPMPAVVRTKKAELRMKAALPSPSSSESNCDEEDISIDIQKRQQWREARYKSLQVTTENTDRVMEQVREISNRLGIVAEETDTATSPPPSAEIEHFVAESLNEPEFNESMPVHSETMIKANSPTVGIPT